MAAVFDDGATKTSGEVRNRLGPPKLPGNSLPSGFPWEKKASCFGWLSSNGTLPPKKGGKGALGSWVLEKASASASVRHIREPYSVAGFNGQTGHRR